MNLKKAKDYIEILKKDSKEGALTFKDLDIIMEYCGQEKKGLIEDVVKIIFNSDLMDIEKVELEEKVRGLK